MTVWRPFLPFAALALGALFLAACGGDDSPNGPVITSAPFPAPDETIDECSLVTPAELGQILPGQTFGAGAPGHYLCNFPGGADRVAVYAVDHETTERAMKALRDRASAGPFQNIDALGDEAFWQTGGNQLSVRTGHVIVVVQVFSANGDQANKDAAVAIARLALPRLPTPSPSPRPSSTASG